MSYRVLVVPEDPTYNGLILNPLIGRILEACGRPNARVTVLANPKVEGYENAKAQLPEILDRYRHFDLTLFIVDADGHDRRGVFEKLETSAGQVGVTLICAAAVQEVEVWLLAGHVDKLDQSWNDVRSDLSVKENVFAAFLAEHGDPRRYGGGRDLLMAETLSNYAGLLQRCPELQELESRICSALETD